MVDFAQAREAMVEGQLRTSGVLDPKLLHAMGKIPREVFLDDGLQAVAYLDFAHRLQGPEGRYLAAPAAFAKLVELAQLQETDIVLDIACGTGYTTAVIAQLANSVVAVENDEAMVTKANQILARLDIGNAAVVKGPLEKGAPGEAPFDAIIIEGAVGKVPATLLDQLRDGGRLVASLGTGSSAIAVLHVKSGEEISRVASFNANLPPLSRFFPKKRFAL